jgi:hypothetical protein
LFGCACCRRVIDLFPDEPFWPVVGLVEQLADGAANQAEVDAALQNAARIVRPGETDPVRQARGNLREAVRKLSGPASHAAIACSSIGIAIRWLGPGEDAECAQQAKILRDIFGNPFRPLPAVKSAWRIWNSGAAIQLARAIYEDRRFQDMPILADALEDAGCQDTEILAHCRQAEGHVRGCWVLDLLLSKDR